MDFGFGSVAPPPAELAKPDKVFMLGRKPLRIDILTGIDGVSFARAQSCLPSIRSSADGGAPGANARIPRTVPAVRPG